MSKKIRVHDDSFYKLANSVTSLIKSNKDGTSQQEQVEGLIRLETEFRDSILRFKQSDHAYFRFVAKIKGTNKNILSARPYFRERFVVFSTQVTPALKNDDIQKLKTFKINFHFISFIRATWRGKFPSRAERLYQMVKQARTKLIENNIPLAINRAKLFYNKTPKNHVSLMDMINVCTCGLMSGIDKWDGPYSRVFLSACIGRMVGNMINLYSETFVHFYPADKKILYKANVLHYRNKMEDMDELVSVINKELTEEAKGKKFKKVTTDDLRYMINSSRMTSTDILLSNNGESHEHTNSYHESNQVSSENIEDKVSDRNALTEISKIMGNLTIMERKVIRLRGVNI